MKTFFALSACLGAASLIGFESDPIQSAGSSLASALEALLEQARAYLDPHTLLGALSGQPIEVPRY